MLKGHTTADVNVIKKEHEAPREETNSIRWMITSNNLNPMPIDGRRPLVTNARVDEIISKEWFADFYETKFRDSSYLNGLGSDLLDMDLSDFDVMEPPETENKINKMAQNIQPIHIVLQKLVEGEYDSNSTDVFDLSEQHAGCIGVKKAFLIDRLKCLTGNNMMHSKYNKMADDYCNALSQVCKSQGKYYVADGTHTKKKQQRLIRFEREGVVKYLHNAKLYTDADVQEDVQLMFRSD